MSFGKSPQVRTAVGSFRQMSGQFSKNASGKKKGGGNIPYFVDMFQPPLNQVVTVRLVPGEYLQDEVIEVPSQTEPGKKDVKVEQVIMQYIKFVDHFDGLKQKGGICSAGALMNFRELRKPCHGCDIYWATAQRQPNSRYESTRMSRQNKYAFSLFDYSVYHKLEQYDQETGQVRTNTQGQAYYNWVRCDGRVCDGCRANVESKQGHMSHWPLSFTQLQVLRAAESNIGQSCVVCQHENVVVSLGWMCGCGEGVIDMTTTQLKDDELLKLTDNLYDCSACGSRGFLKEVYECRTCAARGHQGVRASLWDVDLQVSLVPGGQNNSKILQVQRWSIPYAVDARFEEAKKPIDLVSRYAPMPIDMQAQRFGVVPETAQRAPATNGQQQQVQQTFQPPAQTYANPYARST